LGPIAVASVIRHDPGPQPDQHREFFAGPPEAVAVVSTDDAVPSVLQQLRENSAVKLARPVEFG
jgi:hypothetical protein